MSVENSAFQAFFAMCLDIDETVLPPISWYHIQSFDSKIELLRTVGKLQIKEAQQSEWNDILSRLKAASLSRNAIVHGAQEEQEDGAPYIRIHDLDIGAILKNRHKSPKYTFTVADLREKRLSFDQLAVDLNAIVKSCFPHAFEHPAS